MNESIFGLFVTDERRLQYVKNLRSGVKHLNNLQPYAPGPQDTPVLTVTIESGKRIERVECVLSAPETAVFPLTPTAIDWDLLNWSYRQTWQCTLPAQPEGAFVRYQIWAYPADGSDPLPTDDGPTFSYLVDSTPLPDWAREARIYQIFPDRFSPGNGRSWNPTTSLNDIYGGTLRGVIDNLDYIAEMGFNCLWLNPFFPDKTHHGYHATDHFSINPRLGTLDDMKELVEKGHAKGIRFLLDFVGNHVGSGHRYFQDALANEDSPYHDWFYWEEWPTKYVAYFHVPDLPELNTNNPEVRQYMFDSVRYWLDEIGFDGLRMDYVLGPSHDFWTELRQAVRQVKPDVWMFGEATHTPDWLVTYNGRFDACLDFLLTQHLRDTFAFNTLDIAAFDNFLHLHETFFGANASLPSFLDNHDMDRFLIVAGNDKRKLKLAALCQFTLAGPPIVYNGTEVGVRQERRIHHPDSQGMEECRQPMLWGDEQDADLRETFRRLLHLRRDHPVIWQGQRQTVHLDAAAGTYAYTISNDQESILVLFNLSDQERKFAIHFPDIEMVKAVELAPWSGDFQVIRL
ncbi:MAG: alpha-amylase family glycosyl hydrolase [Chloroflexota bacterium]